MQINHGAPVTVVVEVDVYAAPVAVWEALADFARWREWSEDVTEISVGPRGRTHL
ncbi:MAG: SRPBCC family protein [Candidatus Limnocylindria bacterium]